MKLPDYNLFVMCASLSATLLIVASDARRGFGRVGRMMHCGVVVVGVAVLIWQLPMYGKRLRERTVSARLAQRELQEIVAHIAPKPHQLFLAWASCVPFEYTSPLAGMEEFRDFKLLGIGGCLRTPIAFDRLREFGIEDIYRATFERDDVFIIAEFEWLPLLEKYILEHYGVNVGHRSVYAGEFITSPGRKLNVFQIRVAATTAESRTLQ